MNIIDKNTIESIKAELATGKRTIKAIAAECGIFENQADNDEAKAAYARLADCKSRKEFAAVFATI
ncbi:hypothetical protein MJN71_20815 [Salmonella enterica subsp. enterica serovar Cerro]|nr:hypothetical protein [Salmonella enterica subsp. enterica serovar Cerro]MEB8545725.1 hypothetical protein [Salmonella enterica subsp. enterica serovar Cerro]